MAHPQQICFIETLSKHLSHDYRNIKILEVGSRNVNGAIRVFFEGSEYIGIDLTEGPGVDLVADGHLLDHKENTYDICVSCECFEHNPFWSETFLNMYRMTKEGGFVVFTCATRGRAEHGTQRTTPESSPGTQHIGWDYYLNLEEVDFRRKLDLYSLFNQHLFIKNRYCRDLYFVGQKTGIHDVLCFAEFDFIRELEKNQALIVDATKTARSWRDKPSSLIIFIINLPIRLAIFLPDRIFQTFSISYLRFLAVAKATIRNPFRRRSESHPPHP